MGETIKIGDDITIMVVESRDGKVKLGIEAPRDIPVFRTELLTGERVTMKGPQS